MEAPSPWGSRPLGDLEFPHECTYRAWFRSSTHPYAWVVSPSISPAGLLLPHLLGEGTGDVALSQRSDGSGIYRSRLDFKQCSFDHATRVLQGGIVADSRRPLLYRHAMIALPFRVGFSRLAQVPVARGASFLRKGCIHE
jgi:hypothetical protein